MSPSSPSHTATNPHADKPVVIAVDGPSASGKGTVAKRLAAHFHFAHLDTGLLYRAVGLSLLKQGIDPNDARAARHAARELAPQTIEQIATDPALRDEETGKAASCVAAMPDVRAALLDFQRQFCAAPPEGKKGAVLDGRDIGTVIAPDAPVKLYVTASPEIRAQRRYKELRARGENVSETAILEDLLARDKRDSERATAPAIQATDAHLLDTSALDADAAFAAALAIAQSTLNARTPE